MSLSRKDKQSINEWLEGQRGKPQYRPAPTAGIAVAKVVKPLSKKYKGSSSAAMLHKNWPEIVGQRWGPPLTDNLRPVLMEHSRR